MSDQSVKKSMIASEGKSMAKLIIADQSSEQALYAAQELRYYLERMTGACFEIESISSGQACKGPVIALGQAAGYLGLQRPDHLGEDGFLLKRDQDRILIDGGKRGVIYGAYELLELLGCRFYTPTCEKIPTCENLAMPDVDTCQVPVLEYRYHNYVDFVSNPSFSVKRRINGPVPIDEKMGGHLSYVWFVHTFEHYLLDPKDVFDEHPEYFSLVNGERLRERPQLCLTNPDVLRITIDKVKRALTDHPESRIISVSQNDWGNNCTCESCLKIDQEQGSSAGSLIWFVNQVAEAIEQDFPKVIIDTLAYQYTRPAPRTIRPRHNVCVRLCSIEACFMHSFETCDDQSRQVTRPDGSQSSFIRDLEDWSKVSDRLYIWDYTTCFAHYPMPFPNWNVLQPNMKAFVRNHVKGVFEQACGAGGGSTDFNELRAYLLSKLLWDADCDYEAHMNDFLNGVYGKAGPVLRRYLKLLTDIVEQENIHVGFNDQCDRPYLTDDRLDQYTALFDEAKAAVKDDPIRLARVDRAFLSIRWVRLKNKAMLQNSFDTEETNQFFADWKAHGLTRMDEWVSEKTSHRALLRNVWRGTQFYKNWWDEGREGR